MEKRRSPVLSKHTVQRWDLDKTYLDTDTESLRGLLRIPFERARDKRALPGVAALVKALRRSNTSRGMTTSVNFVTASPPQIGGAIREKLSLDGIEIDEIRFKNQMHHLLRGHFEALREHVGFKLSELMQSVRAGRRDGEELLFGDDWESDALVYSLYADICEGRISWAHLEQVLEKVGVQDAAYLQSIRDALHRTGPRRRVRAICILRARRRPAGELEAFGERLYWFDSYLECALILHSLGNLDAHGVVEVAAASDAGPDLVRVAFESTARRWPRLRREHLTLARKALVQAELMEPVAPGSVFLRGYVRWRARRGRSPMPMRDDAPPLPNYDQLAAQWSRRARREREREQERDAMPVQESHE
ncbi:MAG TPA: hypothetical protein VGK20_16680 [Candidatus Binatia bacterium]